MINHPFFLHSGVDHFAGKQLGATAKKRLQMMKQDVFKNNPLVKLIEDKKLLGKWNVERLRLGTHFKIENQERAGSKGHPSN